jgi:ABC-type multidrug transport system ATPase subunit
LNFLWEADLKMTTILRVNNLTVQKDEDRPGVNRPLAIDNLSFGVSAGELILVVGGPGAGKTTLKSALLRAAKTSSDVVKYAPNVDPRNAESISELPPDLGSNHVIMKDGFQTRVGNPSDPQAGDHWKILERVRQEGATLIAFSEIERLRGWRSNTFTRVIVLHEGRIFADGSPESVRDQLTTKLKPNGGSFRPEDRAILCGFSKQ